MRGWVEGGVSYGQEVESEAQTLDPIQEGQGVG